MVGVRPAAALTGLGGIGKTQLAVEYVYRYQASYPGGIYWINAADLNRVRSGLVETAERMGLRTNRDTTDNALLAGLVKRCQQQPATLLCFDNAPDAVILWRRLTQELNTATLGAAILLTTRRRELPPNMAAPDLRRLSDSTVRQLLGIARPDLLTDPDLPRLLERLGGLPLVVSLVANALHNSPDATIADYLVTLADHGEEAVHEALDVHVEDYDLYNAVYTRTLLPVLREQWDRLCQQPKSENAQLLLRIAGQLPEAAEIPIARLGLLAGLQDEKVIKPLTSAIQSLWKVALIEELKAETIRLHPLVRDFAATLTLTGERASFGMACAQCMATAYSDLQRLGQEYAERGIAALLIDLIIAIDLAQPMATMPQSPIPSLQSLFRYLRLESHHLQGDATHRQPQRIWQQLLAGAVRIDASELSQNLITLLGHTLHWLPQWSHRRQAMALEQSLTDHEGTVWRMAMVDSQRVVCATSDRTLKIWNLHTNQVEQTLTGHADGVVDVAVIDDQRIVSASHDCTLKVWNLHTGQVEQTLTSHADTVRRVAVIDDRRIVSASHDCTLKVWNLHTGQVEQTLTGHTDSVNGVAVVDANRIVSASRDRTLKVWNLLNGQVERTLTGHTDSVNGVAMVDDQRIVSASADDTLKLWNLHTGQVEQTLTGHEGSALCVAVIDPQRIVSAAADCTLKIWNLATGQAEQTLTGHEDWVHAVVVDGQRIVSADEHTLKLWNLATSQAGQTLTGHADRVNAVAVIDGQRIVSASADDTLRIWNLHTGQVEQILEAFFVNAVAVIDGQCIVSADDALKAWSLHTGQVKQTFTGHENTVWDVAVIDANRIVSASADGTLKVWNLRTGQVKQTLTDHVSTSTSGTHKVWNLRTGQVEQTLTDHENWVWSVAVVDGQRIVSAADDGTLKVWNLHTGRVEQTLTGHSSSILKVAVVDDQHIVSASADHTLKVWNLRTGHIKQTLTGHTSWVNAVAVVDTNRIISASRDRTLKVWDLTTGQVIASIGLDGTLQCMGVARQDGRTLVVAGDAGGAIYCLELVEPVAS